jgi:uncharacterized protein
MYNFKKLILIICIIFTSQSYSQSESKKAKILEMISLTGADKLGIQMFNSMIDSFKKSNQNVPEEFWIELEKEVDANELVQLYIPIYDKYYTEEDLENLIVFYKSPTGRKVTSIMPTMVAESMEVGKVWGKNLARKVIDKLESRN